MTLRFLLPLVLPAVLLGAAGCGGSSAGSTPTGPVPTAAASAVAAAAAAAEYLAPGDVERRVGNGFRAGLRRLAAMSQPPDEGADLGQPLPSGQLRGVDCAAGAPRPSGRAPWPWACTVRWATVEGRLVRTAYQVQLTPTGCFAAGADPALRQLRDATAGTYSENPLNTLVGLGQRC